MPTPALVVMGVPPPARQNHLSLGRVEQHLLRRAISPHHTATPVSIDPCVVASFHETVFEGSEVEGALGRRCRYTKGRGRKHLLGVDAHHKALAQKA